MIITPSLEKNVQKLDQNFYRRLATRINMAKIVHPQLADYEVVFIDGNLIASKKKGIQKSVIPEVDIPEVDIPSVELPGKDIEDFIYEKEPEENKEESLSLLRKITKDSVRFLLKNKF